MAVTDWSTTPASNTAVSGINIDEECDPGNINDAIRQIMADLATAIGATGISYITGQGGAVTQGVSKSTGVTLNTLCGKITMAAAGMAANATVGFTLTNSKIAATDVIIINVASGATANSYTVGVDAIGAGTCHIIVRNISAGTLSESVVLNFAVIKAVSA